MKLITKNYQNGTLSNIKFKKREKEELLKRVEEIEKQLKGAKQK